MPLPDILASGEPARLLPVVADSSKETRATSILLSALMSVPPFAKGMLETVGQRVGARADINGYTEVVLKNGSDAEKCRPDGLLTLDGGRGRVWRCLIEAKIGNAQLREDQVEKYLALAKANQVDAVLTLSNQFVALPTHPAVRVGKAATRGVDLFHWSWMYLLTQAMLMLDNESFDRPEQRYILAEVVRYFSHPSTGVSTFDRMNPEWKDLMGRVQAGANILRSEPAVESTAAAWHQEVRDLCLLMTRRVGRPVTIKLSRTHLTDPAQRLRDDCAILAESHLLQCEFEVPDAAAPICVRADLNRRSLCVAISLSAPKDKARTTSKVNWLIRQLAKANPAEMYVQATWPGRAAATQASLADLREDPSCIQSENPTLLPSQFEVRLVRDIAGKFSGTRTFIQYLEEAVPYFYEQAGQHLRAYVAPPPRLRKSEVEEEGQSDLEAFSRAAEGISTDAADDAAKPPTNSANEEDGEEPAAKPASLANRQSDPEA